MSKVFKDSRKYRVFEVNTRTGVRVEVEPTWAPTEDRARSNAYFRRYPHVSYDHVAERHNIRYEVDLALAPVPQPPVEPRVREFKFQEFPGTQTQLPGVSSGAEQMLRWA